MGAKSLACLLAINEKKANSNLAQQKAVLCPVFRLLKRYQIVVVGSLEFHSVKLASWLDSRQVNFAMRQKQETYIRAEGQDYQKLRQLGLVPGMQLFLSGVTFSKIQGFGQFNLAAYWQRKQRGKRNKKFAIAVFYDMSVRKGIDPDFSQRNKKGSIGTIMLM